MPEADVGAEVVLLDGLAQVGQDLVGARNRVVARPGLELVAEGVEVGVGADAGVAEEVPGAPDGVATLEDREGLLRQAGLQVIRRADPGDAGADDQDVEVVGGERGVDRVTVGMAP